MKIQLDDKEYYRRLRARCLYMLILVLLVGFSSLLYIPLGIFVCICLSMNYIPIYKYILRIVK